MQATTPIPTIPARFQSMTEAELQRLVLTDDGDNGFWAEDELARREVDAEQDAAYLACSYTRGVEYAAYRSER